MLYAWIGYLKAGADPIPQSVQQETTDFLGQPSIKIRTAGPLRDESGKRAAMMMVFEHGRHGSRSQRRRAGQERRSS